MSCKRITKKADIVCVGNLDELITLYTRDIQPPTNVKYTEKLSGGIDVWAMVKTTAGTEIFDSTNQLIGNATHQFIIRYDDTITAEHWLEFDTRYFDVLDIEKLNENKRFMILRCSERGKTSSRVNLV